MASVKVELDEEPFLLLQTRATQIVQLLEGEELDIRALRKFVDIEGPEMLEVCAASLNDAITRARQTLSAADRAA